MVETKQRVMWLDVFKGLAIMAVVLNHHPFLPSKPFTIVASFAVPLFFFMSGYLFNPNVPFRDHIRKRFNSLLKPYIFTLILVSLSLFIIKGTPSLLWYFFWIIYGNGPNLPKVMLHLWFLPNLFLVTVFVWILFSYFEFLKSSILAQLVTITVMLVLGFLGIGLFWDLKIPISVSNLFMTDGNLFLINGLLNNPEYSKEALLIDKQYMLKGLPWSLDFALITSAFFMCGYLIKQNRIENLFHKGSIAVIMLFVFIITHFIFNYILNLNIRRYDNLFTCTIVAFAAIYCFIYLSYCITKVDNRASRAIKYIGRYSLVVFIFHPSIQSKVYFVLTAILPKSINFIAILISFITGICLPLLINWLLLERFNIFRYWYYSK